MSRSYRGGRSFLDWSTRYWGVVGIAIWKSLRSLTDSKVSSHFLKPVFREKKNTDMNAIPSTLPTYSWTVTLIPNWTCSVVTIPLSNAWLPSMWLTVVRILVRNFKTPIKKIVDCKVLQFIHTMKIKKMLSHKTLRCKYTATSSRERDELGQELCLRSQFAWTEFAQCLCNLCIVWRLLKQFFYMSRVRRKEGL